MPRYALDLTFDGTRYAGWQRQPNAVAVQQRVEETLTTLLRQETPVVGAGRTDAGVHARQLVAHFDWEEALPEAFLQRLNGILPADIAANEVLIAADPEFHARFSATARAYTYQVATRKSPLAQGQVMWVRQPLDFDAMQQAADLLQNYEEFGAFCKSHADNQTNLCRIDRAEWVQAGEGLWHFHIQADRFLRGMVRAIVGSMIWVGSGKWQVADFQRAIESQDRRQAGPAADAQGLFLVKVAYPVGMLRPWAPDEQSVQR